MMLRYGCVTVWLRSRLFYDQPPKILDNRSQLCYNSNIVAAVAE